MKMRATLKSIGKLLIPLNPLSCFSPGPGSPVGNMSGNRCESDSRSRGRELDPGPVLYFRGD